MSELRQAKTLRIYACGGMAQNIGRTLEKYRSKEDGFADTDIVYIDTSASNLTEELADKQVYLLKDLDGGGKIRKDNIEAISKAGLDIIQQYKPGDFNIIINSAGGASGSTIGPTLTRHLLDKDQMVVVITVGSIATHIEAQNTINTLKSYEGVSMLTKRPVNMVYLENKPGQSRKQVDEQVVYHVNDLKVLFSGQNAELDTRDIYNWLRFERSTSAEAKLTIMTVGTAEELKEVDLGNVHSVAILTVGDTEPEIPYYTEYRCNGYVPEVIAKTMEGKSPMYFALSNGPIQEINKHLQSVIKDMEDKRNSQIKAERLLDKNDDMNDNGLVL